MEKTAAAPFKILILGLPNTGKSQIFNNLTGQYTMVANFPFTTVESKSGQCQIQDRSYAIIDTPGIHCLYIHSEEELFVRDLLLHEKPDVIIQCIDANRLKQSLTLTYDLLELNIPMVISLNAIDETIKKGIWIDSAILSQSLGIPVIESIAINGIGTNELKNAIYHAKPGNLPDGYGENIEKNLNAIKQLIPRETPFKKKIALLLLLEDPFLFDSIKHLSNNEIEKQLKDKIKSIKKIGRINFNSLINRKKNLWIEYIIQKTVRKHKVTLKRFSETFARLSRHPIYGIPIMIFILTAMFLSVVNIANEIASWMNDTFWVPIENTINHLVPSGFLNDFLIGDYGFLTFGVSNAILTVLPILSVFFIIFNSLEDIGYIPNLTVLLKKISEKLGLTGSALMPITLGFGCKTMATLTTKSLRSKKERYISIYLIAFALPCAAQMALNMSILGSLGLRAFMIAFGVLVTVEIGAGLFLNKILKDEKKTNFIQSLPDIRMPNPKAVLKKTYYKLYWFLKEAIPIFVSAAIFLFFIDKLGVLDIIKNIFRPVIIDFLGFPIEMVEVLILCMAKHEAAAGMIIKLIQAGKMNYIQSIVAVCLTTMFVPCLSNIVAMIKELKLKSALIMVFAINFSAILIAGALNWVLIFTLGQ